MVCLILDLLFIKEKCHKLFGLFASLISQLKDILLWGNETPHLHFILIQLQVLFSA